MCDEVAGICVSCVPLLVDSTGARLGRAVVVDDNFVDREDGEGSCYAAGGGDSLVGGVETGKRCQWGSLLGVGSGQVKEGPRLTL